MPQINEVLTGVIDSNLDEAIARFTAADVTWSWELTGETSIRYRMDFDDADSSMRLVVDIPWSTGPVHDYAGATFYFETETTVSSSSTRVNTALLPSPDAATVASMTTFTVVLDYLADFADRLVHT